MKLNLWFIFLLVSLSFGTGLKPFSKVLLVSADAPPSLILNRSPYFQPSPSNDINAFKQILNGYTYGTILSGAGLALGVFIARTNGGDAYEMLANGVFGGLAGFVGGSAYGVYSYGKKHNGRGSFWITLIGSALGGAVAIFPAPISAQIAYQWSNDRSSKTKSNSSILKYKQPLNLVIRF